MKIYFRTTKGIDPSRVWKYDTVKNRATSPYDEEKDTADLPEGVGVKGKLLVIDDLKGFARNHPYSRAPTPAISLKTVIPPPNLSPPKVSPSTKKSLTFFEHTASSSKLPKLPLVSRGRGFSDSIRRDVLHKNENEQNSPLSRQSSAPTITKPSAPIPIGGGLPIIRSRVKSSRARAVGPGKTYPKSLCLADLINDEFNLGDVGETIIYRRLLRNFYEKNKPEDSSQPFLINDGYFFVQSTKNTSRVLKLKVKLLDKIEEILGLFNQSYQVFYQNKELSHIVGKEITDYFCAAVVQTMGNGDFKRIQTDFQALPEKGVYSLFMSNAPDISTYFVEESLALKTGALLFNWSAVIHKNLNQDLSLGPSYSHETCETLKAFKIYLQEESPEVYPKICSVFETMRTVLLNLIAIEQAQEISFRHCLNAFDKREEEIDGYRSLHSLLREQVKVLVPLSPVFFGLHLTIQERLANTIFRNILSRLSQDKFDEKGYGPYIPKISSHDNDLYINPNWLVIIEECFNEIPVDKKITKKLVKMNLNSTEPPEELSRFMGKIEERVYQCIYTLIRSCLVVPPEEDEDLLTGFIL